MRTNCLKALIVCTFPFSACVTPSGDDDIVSEKPAKKPSESVKVTPEVPKVPEPSKEDLTQGACVAYGERGDLPWFFAEAGFVVTKIRGECTTEDGENGFPSDAAWVAMGFPCYGGGGRFDIKGKSLNYPRMVSLRLSTDCPMQPAAPAVVEKMGKELMGLSETSRLLAYYPFALQFWEVLGHVDSNVGFSIELRSLQATGSTWRAFLKEEPLKVRLYGRENSWVGQGQYFQIESSFVYTGNQSFKMIPEEFKVLEGEDIDAVKDRCRSLKPPRPCHHAF